MNNIVNSVNSKSWINSPETLKRFHENPAEFLFYTGDTKDKIEEIIEEWDLLKIIEDTYWIPNEKVSEILRDGCTLNLNKITNFPVLLERELRWKIISLLREKEVSNYTVIGKYNESLEWNELNNHLIEKLEVLLNEYEKTGDINVEIKTLEDILNWSISSEIEKIILSKIWKKEENKTYLASGAENNNYIDSDGTIEKTTKWRHSHDYFSMLQLILNMRKVEKEILILMFLILKFLKKKEFEN